MNNELLITIVGRVALPDGLFAQARRIAEVETSINALRAAAAGSVDDIEFQVDASLVPAGTEPEPAPSAQTETAAQAETRRRRRTKAEMDAARAAEAAGQTPAVPPEQPTPQTEQQKQQIDLEEAIAATKSADDSGITPTASVVVTGQTSVTAQDIPLIPAPAVEQPGRVDPPWAKKPNPAPVAVAQPALLTAPAAQNGGDRIPVYAADGTVFSSFKSVENAAEKLIELVNGCETCVTLDGLMTANEHITDWPQALRVSVYNAASDRDTALRAAGKMGE